MTDLDLAALAADPSVKALAERLVQKMIDEAEIDTGQTNEPMLRLALHRACLALAIAERDRAQTEEPIRMFAEMHAGKNPVRISTMTGKDYWCYISSDPMKTDGTGKTMFEAIRACYANWQIAENQRQLDEAREKARYADVAVWAGAAPAQPDTLDAVMRNAG